MLTKIGNDWVDLAEIAGAEYAEATKLDPERFLVTLRSGGTLCLYCSPGKLEDALIRAGVAAYGESRNVPGSVPEEALQKLLELLNTGFPFLARDGDGKVYAYRNRPRRDGPYWAPATADDGEVLPLGREAFPFVETEAEPFDIREFFAGPDVLQPDVMGPGADEAE